MNTTPRRLESNPDERAWLQSLSGGIRSGNLNEFLGVLDQTKDKPIGEDCKSKTIGMILGAKYNKPPGKVRVAMITAYLAREDAVLPPEEIRPQLLVDGVIKSNALGAIPALYAAGFRLKGTAQEKERLASEMAKGRWPHPELLAPDILSDRQAVWKIDNVMFTKPMLKRDFVLKLIALEAPEQMNKGVSRQFLVSQKDLAKTLTEMPRPQVLASLSLLIDRGWINPGLVEDLNKALSMSKGEEDSARILLAEAMDLTLQRNTPSAPRKNKPGMRL